MTSAQIVAPAGQTEFSRGYRAWLLLSLLVINVLNLADRQGMAAVAPAIKADLGLTDTQLGLILGLGFAIFHTLMGLPMARMAERMSRTRIIAVSVVLFAATVALCGVARNFWHILLFRVGVGIGEAGMGPPVASLIGDHFPQNKRASAMTWIWLGAPIGAVGGSVLGGLFAEDYGWRAWFYALGVPAAIVGVLAFLTLREPRRGMSDEAPVGEGPPPSILAVFRFLLAKRSMIHVLIGAALAATAMNALGQFFGRYLVANFDMGFAEAGRILGLIAGLSMASGLALGGFGVDWLGKSDRRWYVWAPAIGLVLSAPLFFFGAAQSTVTGAVIVLMAAHVCLFVYFTPTLALAQNMVGARMRASSAFVVLVVLNLVGGGLGPTVIGVLSDLFAAQAFAGGDFAAMCPGGAPPPGATGELAEACSTAAAAGLRHAIMAMSLLFAWGGLHFFLAGRRLRQDLDTRYEEPGAPLAAPALH